MKTSVSLLLGIATVLFPLAAHATEYIVTSTKSSGPDTLRQAILDANSNSTDDTIRFAVLGGALLIQNAGKLTIIGPPSGVELNAGYTNRIFTIGGGANATISNLTLRNGQNTSADGALFGNLFQFGSKR